MQKVFVIQKNYVTGGMDLRESTTVRGHLATKSIDIPANDGLSVCPDHVVRREFHKVSCASYEKDGETD